MISRILFELGSGTTDLVEFSLLVINYTWFLLIPIFIWLGLDLWVYYRNGIFSQTLKYEIFAVSVPADNVRDPKFMEQIISGVHSIEKPFNFVEKWWEGRYQTTASLEIVSIDGHVRFLLRVEDKYRKQIENYVYAYYPEAEIMQVEDYVTNVPSYYPDEEWEMWGTEAKLQKDDIFPIKTYSEFVEDIEKGFIDPIAQLVESMSAIESGEQMWFQIILRPTWDRSFQDRVQKHVDSVMKRTQASKPSWVQRYLIGGWHNVEKNIDTALGFPIGEDFDDDGRPELPMLSPGERTALQAIEINRSRLVFLTKMRFIYVAKKEVFNKGNGFMAILTFMRLFIDENNNGLAPNTKNWTSRDYFKKWRVPPLQRTMMGNFKGRDWYAGGKAFHMTTQEIATLYHYPYASVKAPTIERTDTRKAEPPADLPINV